MRWPSHVLALGIALALMIAFSSPGIAAEREPLLCMRATDLATEPDGMQILLIELQRQAILLVAREDFGAYTRDETCGERIPGDTTAYGQLLDVNVVASKPGLWNFVTTLSGRLPDGTEKRVAIPLATSQYSPQTMHRTFLEATDRQCSGEIPAALESLGLQRSARPEKSEELPANMEMRLGEMNYFAQYEVLRQIHPRLREQPDSPELLSIAARAYAHLGQLTRFHYDGSSKAFAARSLLYAQRLLKKHPDRAESLWTRAYVCALAGIHVQALSDLTEGDRLAAGKSRPVWASAAELLCKYDRKGLGELRRRNPEYAPMASFMAFITLEHSKSPALILKAADRVLAGSPYCFRVLDAASANAGVGPNHELTSMAFEATAEALRTELPADLPAKVQQVHEANRRNPIHDVAKTARAMVLSTMPCEPSLAMLGNMVEQTSFAQVYRRANFMAFWWGVETDGFLAQALPLFERHELRGLIETCSDASRSAPESRSEYFRQLRVRFWSPQLEEVMLNPSMQVIARTVFATYSARVDNTAYDAEIAATSVTDGALHWWVIPRGRMLMSVSPHNPAGPALLVSWGDGEMMMRIPELKRRFVDSPLLFAKIGYRQRQSKDYAAAAETWEGYLAIANDAFASTELAECCFELKDDDRAIAVMKKSLQYADSGLEHAGTLVKMAEHYMDKGDYKAALPHAEAAAESWAGWAMHCAAECNEKLGRWAKAATWYQRMDERYGGVDYYGFCVRTGRGDRKAALADARGTMQQWLATGRQVDTVGAVRYLEGDMDAAVSLLQKAATESGSPWAAILAAGIYDAKGKQMERDAMLTLALKPKAGQTGPYRAELRDLAKQMLEAIAEGPDEPLSEHGINALFRTASPDEKANIQYMSGMFLLQHGDTEAGIKLLRDCAEGSRIRKLTTWMAIDELRRRKVIPAQAVAYRASTTKAIEIAAPKGLEK